MRFKKTIVLLLVPLFLLGCAGHKRKQAEIKEVFATDIKENGIKLFSYSVTRKASQDARGDRRSGQRGSRGQGGGSRGGKGGGMRGGQGQGTQNRDAKMAEMKEKMFEKLDAKLAETGYCREGYIELDYYAGKSQTQIRGECKEGATEDDREKFFKTASETLLLG